DNQNNLNRGNLAGIIDNIPAGEDHPDQNQSFEYDDLNRLRLAHGPYGPGGSPGTLGYQINEIGNITSAPDNPPATGTVPNKSDQNQLLYDYDNRVTSITNIRGTTTFTYNDRGSRVKKTKGTSETVYLGKLLEMRDGTPIKHIFAGNRRIATSDGVETFYYHPDHLGSLNVATNSDGEVSQIVTYYPYGEIRTNDLKNNNPIDLPHKFTGQEYDNETGLYYFVARYYDPAAGRFLTPDTIVQSPGDPQALNRYAYCRNNPLMYTDPTGHFWFAFFIGMAIGALMSGIQSDWNLQAMAIGGLIGGVSAGVFSAVSGPAGSFLSHVTLAGQMGPPMAGMMLAGQIGGGMIGGAAGGLSAGFYGGNIGESMLKGAGYGAVSGAAFGGIRGYYGNAWTPARVGIQALASGGLAELSGGDFKNAALFAFGTAAAAYGYQQLVGYSATPESGGEAVQKDPYTWPVAGHNNIGVQGGPLDPNGLWNEGGRVSVVANQIPGINAVAGLHDTFQVGIDKALTTAFNPSVGDTARTILNVPGMLRAAAWTYGALMANF
ncbi:MAG: RHS repeat-associated core domain-containing protein, partial [Syntrophobacteraceae bacterium]